MGLAARSGAGAAVSRRTTPASARGGPMLWFMGLGLVASLLMVGVLLGLILNEGASTFWPKPIERLEFRDGAVGVPAGDAMLGNRVQAEAFDPSPEQAARIEALREAGADLSGAVAPDGRPLRRQYRIGNREAVGAEPENRGSFPWVPVYEIESVQRPRDAVMLERRSWGVWFGVVEAVRLERWLEPDAPVFERRPVETTYGPGVATRTRVRGGEQPGAAPFVREIVRVPLEGERALAVLEQVREEAAQRLERLERLEEVDRARINARLSAWEHRLRTAAYEHERWKEGARAPIPVWAWAGAIVGTIGLAGVGVRLGRGGGARSPTRKLGARVAWAAAAAGVLVVALEHPWSAPGISGERLERIRAEYRERVPSLERRGEAIDARIQEIRAEDARYRVVVRDPRTGRVASEDLGSDVPMRVSQIVRVVPSNRLDWGDRVGVYLDRWGEFLSAEPRSGTREGGVFPVIVGTVTLTLLLTIAVVPLGVMAAIYLREYAPQGLVTSTIRIGVNNLAGVPSIVYGVFGLGFFCYTAGKYVDAGPGDPLGRWSWWGMLGAMLVALLAGSGLGLAAHAVADRRGRTPHWHRLASAAVWLGVIVLAGVVIARTPYFDGFFAAKASMGTPTFGTRGILWASLTLALLTLPVVIVATEEAIAAVPNSLREGSYGCGASKWQTVRRIVLPGALPGVMTGAILAIARGAGEVAPLMLVGAVKLAPDLPISGEFPFIHPERSFMHLGFHIYDLGSKSPDVQAALPMVWTTTLLLISVVLILNLVAITVRSRLRRRAGSGL